MALQRLGPFELLKVLGRGGMGTVYEAREKGDDKRVAVKALSPALSFDEHFRNRFEAEIDALMSLDHKNIVRLLSYGQDEGNLFFAMELVDGTSLYQEQKQGQVFHWREAIDIGIQVCHGLRHAHDRGIIHRDLKPGNLMIDADRQVKITDFGIAKSFGQSPITSEGNVLGTMDFMAPEQARGRGTNARSDLFSLGAVLYSLLAGRPPFLRDSVEKTFEALLSDEPPPRLNKIAGDIPEPLAKLVHRLMEKDPARRIATAQATGRQLQHVLDIVSNSPKNDTQILGSENDFDTANTSVETDHQTGNFEEGDTDSRQEARSQQTDPDGTRISERPLDAQRPKTTEIGPAQPDYFNEVTPLQRQKKSEIITVESQPTSIWPVLLALIAVLAVSAVGVWYALFQQPDREQLLRTIRMSQRNPIRIQDEIAAFEKWFPDDEEAAFIDLLKQRVKIARYCNNLSYRKEKAINNPLTQIESRFLETFLLSRENVPLALEQIESFLRLYGESPALSEDDRKAVDMARLVKTDWVTLAEQQIAESAQYIDDAIRRARKSGNKEDARALYQSVIDIYGQDSWARERLETARKELQALDDPASDQSN